MLVDSHCHLDRVDLSEFNDDFQSFIQDAREKGVGQMLCVSIDLENYPDMLALVEDYDDIFVSVGVHPNEEERREPDVDELVGLAKHPKNIAIGETGLDYFRSDSALEWQQDRFRTHIRAARMCQKPLIIHTRDAREDTIRIMREEQADICGGVMHCFTESWEMAREALDLGFYISFSGIVTFKNADDLREVAKKVPEDRILIETDSPYLAPVPHRGKSNRPQYVQEVANCIASLRGMHADEVAIKTAENFNRLFGGK